MRPQLFVIRGPDGKPEAIHERIERREGPGLHGKLFTWWTLGPDGEPVKSVQGRPVADLPLFGSQHVNKWLDTPQPVYLVEGEKATMALASAGYRALGTLGSATPGDAAMAVLIGLDVILWPDHDAVGRKLMMAVAAKIEPAVASLRWVDWPDAPKGGDAADYLAGGLKIEDLPLVSVPKPEPAPVIPIASRRRRSAPLYFADTPIRTFNNAVTVSEVLRRDYGPWKQPEKVAAGRTVLCPFHEEKHGSLSILPDDRRVYCHVGTCWGNNDGRGRDAWDLAHKAIGAVAQ